MTEHVASPHADPEAPDPPITEPPPETGDDVVDAALQRLAAVPEDDLDRRLEAGEDVQRTLRSRLGDLGG